MANKHLNEEQRKMLVSDYMDGMRTKDVASKFGVTGATVRNTLLRNGIKPNQEGLPISAENERLVCVLYENGESMNGLAARFGRVRSVIRNALLRNDVEVRPRIKPDILSTGEKLMLVGKYKDGAIFEELAAEFGIATSTVGKILKKHGVVCPPGWKRFRTHKYKDVRGREHVFKSTWELKYAKHMDESGLTWDYEPTKFGLPRCQCYTPDFRVELDGGGVVYREVKGWLDEKSMDRVEEFIGRYPKVKLEILGPVEMVELGLIESWYLNHHMAKVVSDFKLKIFNLRESRFLEAV